eukprot:scaffold1518_cov417-Prasinococcus_capsulatus_cf.AAC.29
MLLERKRWEGSQKPARGETLDRALFLAAVSHTHLQIVVFLATTARACRHGPTVAAECEAARVRATWVSVTRGGCRD